MAALMHAPQEYARLVVEQLLQQLVSQAEKLNTVDSSGITKLEIDNNTSTSIILSNIDSNGSNISKPLDVIGSKADITLLSPGGIEIYDGFAVENIQNLTLTTANKISIGDKVFDINETSLEAASLLAGQIDSTSANSHWASDKQVDIIVSGNLTIDSNLFISSESGRVYDSQAVSSLEDQNILLVNGNFESEGAFRFYGANITADSIRHIGEGVITAGESLVHTEGLNLNKTILTSSGDINIDGQGMNDRSGFILKGRNISGVTIKDSKLKSTNGNIYITGQGGNAGEMSGSDGISLSDTELVVSGDLTMIGRGGTATTGSNMSGLSLKSNDLTVNGNITLDGIAGGGVDASSVYGIYLELNKWVGGGNANLIGTGGTGTNLANSTGVYSYSDNWLINGHFDAQGHGGQGVKTDGGVGVGLYSQTTLEADSFSFIGTGGQSTNPEDSVYGMGVNLGIFSDLLARTGDIAATGIGGNAKTENRGVSISSGTKLKAPNGKIFLDGHGGTGDVSVESEGVGLNIGARWKPRILLSRVMAGIPAIKMIRI